MSMTIAQQAALEKPLIRYVYFVEFFFASATVRVCTLNITVPWRGYDWMGLGSIGDISPIEKSQGVAAKALTFELNLAQTSWLALGVGPVEEYRGRDARMYFCPLNDSFQLEGTPKRCWQGTMDTMTSGITGPRDQAKGSIRLKCETSAYSLKRPPALRLNAAQQKMKFPNDASFDRLCDLIGKPTPWLTVRYQRR